MLYDPHRRWAPRGICRWEDRKLFFADGGLPATKPGPRTAARWEQAKEICRMCPVLAECQRDTLGEEYGVYGGRDPYERFRIRRRLSVAVDRWDEPRRLMWAKEVYELREAGLLWRSVQAQTGIPRSAGEKLVKIWKEHLKEKGAKGEVVDLELPEPEREKKAFPDRPGRRDAWVRHRGLVSDAWYRGETPDGEWLCFTTTAGRGQVHKFFHKTDVQMYRPSAVVILNYIGRPDSDDNSRDPDPDTSVA